MEQILFYFKGFLMLMYIIGFLHTLTYIVFYMGNHSNITFQELLQLIYSFKEEWFLMRNRKYKNTITMFFISTSWIFLLITVIFSVIYFSNFIENF